MRACRRSVVGITAALLVLLAALPVSGQTEPPDPHLIAVLVTSSGYLAGFVVSVHSLQVYLTADAVPFEVRFQTYGNFEYQYSADDALESVAGVEIDCVRAGVPARIGAVEFTYSGSHLLSAGSMHIGYERLPRPVQVKSIDGVRIRYREMDGRVQQIGGAFFDYGPFEGPITGISGTVQGDDVIIGIVSDLCPTS